MQLAIFRFAHRSIMCQGYEGKQVDVRRRHISGRYVMKNSLSDSEE